MKALIAAAVALVAVLVGIVVVHEQGRQRARSAATGHIDAGKKIATISTGECVDIDHSIPANGLVLVEFTADF